MIRQSMSRFGANDIENARRAGLWSARTIADDLEDRVVRQPDRVQYISDAGSYSNLQLLENASALAAALSAHGVRRGDVISFQLPNCIEAAAIDMAGAMMGAILNPIAPIYRHGEMRRILSDSGSKAIFVPHRYRNVDFVDNAKKSIAQLPDPPLIVVLHSGDPAGDGVVTFENLLNAGKGASWARPVVAPDAIKFVLYTSGTTGVPKGVLHTHETTASIVRRFYDVLGLSEQDVMFMPSTITHSTGYVNGLQTPMIFGNSTVLMDRWSAEAAHATIEKYRCTVTVGAKPFLTDLCDYVRATGRKLPTLRYFACGGASVSPADIRTALDLLSPAKVFRMYGSTEAGNTTIGFIADGEEDAAAETDGKVYDYDIKLVDSEIAVRGPALFAGYTDRAATEQAFDDEGFFYTGDLGVLGRDNSLTITGRKKDLIIRGGYNISAKEIEDALHEHPSVLECAVVGKPDERLGETICAFIVPTPSHEPPTIEAIAAFLAEKGLSKQKYPETAIAVVDFPKTPAGKIKKFALRETFGPAG